jgi:hypothetical protein
MAPENPPAEKEPTIQDVMAIAEKAGADAAAARTAAEARPEVRQTIKDEAAARGLDLSDEDCKRIADVTITQLEARGAFDETPPPGPAESPPPAEAPAEPAAPAHPEGAAPSGAGHSEGDPPPKKRTFAERFMGR